MREQKLILESIVDDLDAAGKGDYFIFDRCPLDNIVYSLWAYDKGVGDFDDKFIADCIKISRLAIQKLDLMILIPLTKHDEVIIEDGDLREVDPIYRKEINELFQGLKRLRDKGDNDMFFVKGDSAPILEVFGGREARLEMCRLYVKEDGGFYGEEDSFLLDANGDAIRAGDDDNLIDTGERDQLRKELGLD